MTEYTTSSQAYREFMASRDRTARWLSEMSGAGPAEFYSPSVPPSVLDGLVPSSPPSEADSSYSTPPKMILRYGDGRPDVPIPHTGGMGRAGSKRHRDPRSQNPSYNPARTRSGSSQDSPSYGSHSHPFESEPRAPPEEIRILPTYAEVPTSSNSSRPTHSRSKSLPRTSDHRHRDPEPEVPYLPSQHMSKQAPSYYPHAGSVNPPHASAPPQQVNFAQASQWPPQRLPHSRHAPAVVYAPSHHTQRPNYVPPAMFHHPPQMGPNGMIYSHSAPVPGQYPPAYPTPYPSAVGSNRHTSSAHDVRVEANHRGRLRSMGRSTRVSPTESSESLASEKSGSTYYVLPAHGQKVHVIAPSPEQSVMTATSTTKSASPPHFPIRKPFFQRFFNFKKFSHAGSTHESSGVNGRKLHRRHSLSGANGGL
ncbi:hypothetical protein BDN70DRAFT_698295 [Pholiota conissans]|uniref:Uncharacterized protein n=1 Tax=Pholiota conissans TaxID=109636 RepID=A0A9P5Z138_9AGAR|nr:hypothetical protein BDN70DRAFT_698295 [Pholiota conissans]